MRKEYWVGVVHSEFRTSNSKARQGRFERIQYVLYSIMRILIRISYDILHAYLRTEYRLIHNSATILSVTFVLISHSFIIGIGHVSSQLVIGRRRRVKIADCSVY